MSFKSLNHVLGALQSQEGWRSRQQLQQLLACWFQVVGPAVAAQTRPISIQRRVLHVATSSSVWASNLTFERQRILDKLSTCLPYSLSDIRFSTAHWQPYRGNTPLEEASESSVIWQKHPSRVADPVKARRSTAKSEQQDANSAFRRWAEVMQARSHHLPLCPRCYCPTPEGELKRWTVCSLCISKRW
jgi:predicted nucleic acid-binding Zn ribbon protein